MSGRPESVDLAAPPTGIPPEWIEPCGRCRERGEVNPYCFWCGGTGWDLTEAGRAAFHFLAAHLPDYLPSPPADD